MKHTTGFARPAWRWERLQRARFQISLGLVVAIILPALIHYAIAGPSPSINNLYNSAIGSVIALVVGYTGYRRLNVFPGYAAGGYVITAFSMAFGGLAVALIMLRIDYSRLQLLISYLLAVGLFTFIHLRFFARRPLLLGVIPNGATDKLPQLGRVVWHRLESPSEATPPLEGVVVDLHATHSDEWNTRIAAFALEGTPVYHVSQAIEQLTGRVEINHLSENMLGSLNPNHFYLKLKEVLDFIAALLLLAITSPVLIIVAALIRFDTPGPALFRQERTGFRAQPFTIFKFRTMRVTAPRSESEARSHAITLDNDPRITRLGAFLRKSRLDELPQLINVIRGEMSLIGPRPEAVPLTRWYETEIPFYHYRHIIKPGITGWSQINIGHVADVDNVRKKLDLDFYYVKNFSAWLDILIVLRTVQTMLNGHGAK